MINAASFIGNAIDLGTKTPVETLTKWMHPNVANEPCFKYPPNRLLKFCGTLSNDEMQHLNPKNVDSMGKPTVMVLKRGCGSGLTIGCLNNLRSVCKMPDDLAEYSMMFAVWPRASGVFSRAGDSGAAVINGHGAVAGVIAGGSVRKSKHEEDDEPHCTYITPISFILERLQALGFSANIFLKVDDVFVKT